MQWRMELLANYDDGENSENATSLEKIERSPPESIPKMSTITLEKEMENFERMINDSSPDNALSSIPLPVPPPVSRIPLPGDHCPPTINIDSSSSSESASRSPPTKSHSTSGSSSSSEDEKGPPKKKISSSISSSHSSPTHSSPAHSDAAASSTKASSPKVPIAGLHIENCAKTSASLGDTIRCHSNVVAEGQPLQAVTIFPYILGGPSHMSLQSPTTRSRSRSRSKSISKHRSHSPSHDRHRRSSDHGRRRRRHSGHHRHHSGHLRRRHDSRERSHKRRSSRSRSRDRHRRKHRRHSSRSKSRRSPHHSRRHRRSRSPQRRSGRDSKRSRSRSRSPSSHRRRSRSRSRSAEKRSHAPEVEPRKKHLTYKEQLRQQLLKASKILSEQGSNGAASTEGLGAAMEKPSNLPLNATNVFSNASAGATNVTPQMALFQTMAAMHQKAQEMTGIAVPKYYNPAAVNPIKYAEQVQKRKLLWSKKEKKEESGQWQSSTFLPDQDGKQTAKFRKLMGMKEDVTDDATKDVRTSETVRKQEELFQRLDKEYEFARMATHTHRGVGLGFQSHSFSHQ